MINNDNVKLNLDLKGNLEKMLRIIKNSKSLVLLSWGVLMTIILSVAIFKLPEILKILVLHQA